MQNKPHGVPQEHTIHAPGKTEKKREGGERRRHWDRFKAYARRHHENFLLAAQAFAWAICQVVHLGVPVETAKASP